MGQSRNATSTKNILAMRLKIVAAASTCNKCATASKTAKVGKMKFKTNANLPFFGKAIIWTLFRKTIKI